MHQRHHVVQERAKQRLAFKVLPRRRSWIGVAVLGHALILFSSGCALTYPPNGPKSYAPDTPHPSKERIAELLDAPVPTTGTTVPKVGTFTLKAPAFVLAGQAAWLRCYVPERLGPGFLRLELAGHDATGPAPVRKIETSMLVKRVDCGTWTASCAFLDANGDTKRLERQVIARGSCNEGDSDR
jgi:hypothetical protein